MIVSDKRRVFFRLEGEKGAYLILFHGLLGCHEDWIHAGYMEDLAREFRLILVDARGHGRSDRMDSPEEYSLAAFGDDVVGILDHLDIRNAHFIGYSLGALVGFDLLVRHPDRLRVAILGGESPFVTPECLEGWGQWNQILEKEGLPGLLSILRDGRLPYYSLEEDPAEEASAKALLAAMAQWPVNTNPTNPVNSPLTLVAGSEDPACSRAEAAAKTIPRARFTISQGLNHLTAFLQRTPLEAEIDRLIRTGKKQGEDPSQPSKPTRRAEPDERVEPPEAAETPGPTESEGFTKPGDSAQAGAPEASAESGESAPPGGSTEASESIEPASKRKNNSRGRFRGRGKGRSGGNRQGQKR
ncbi:MAG: alpha/beta fold hydrolase [Deltaproteobacteria bacterium]|nr:alpha/beta fold hydrolase [Deltaproteobacteria bacterium]